MRQSETMDPFKGHVLTSFLKPSLTLIKSEMIGRMALESCLYYAI